MEVKIPTCEVSKLFTFNNILGDKWHQRRKILTPTFHFSILEQFLTIFQEEAERLIDTIKETVDWQNILDVEPMAKQFTLNTVCGI